MSAIPGNLDTDQQPPMTVPLRHFVVALGFLIAGISLGIGLVADAVPGSGRLAHIHLLLAGWVCITIMGAMTQFVPVWSGTNLHSRRLANVQLGLVTVGLSGFALAFVAGAFTWLVGFGAVLLLGFWVFVYNVGRSLATVGEYDVTEGHFLFALLCFCLLTTLGITLALNLAASFSPLPFAHTNILGAHVTLAVFGAVLSTIYGALYQLATMFTQTQLHGLDNYFQTIEAYGHPAGVVLLAGGRLTDSILLARIGAVLVLVAALVVAIILGRKLYEMQVEWTPMHSRYTVVAPALAVWALLAAPAWLDNPVTRAHLFGAEGSAHLFVLGVVGFVVLGTLYHIVPFIIWVHQYSDLLGFEDVPMIDDLYSDRLAALDFWLLLGGTSLLAVSDLADLASEITGIAGGLISVGILVFLVNMALVVRRHSPHSLDRIVFGSMTPRRDSDDPTPSEPQS
jgi:hypothetical protein